MLQYDVKHANLSLTNNGMGMGIVFLVMLYSSNVLVLLWCWGLVRCIPINDVKLGAMNCTGTNSAQCTTLWSLV